MPECIICGGDKFYAESGFYFCQECQTQNQEIREEVLELRVDPTTRVRKIKIRHDKSSTSEQNVGWTSWEQHNFILIGMTNELVELGASSEIKMTILQLWAHYLAKLEVAFTSTKRKTVPKLARTFYKRDAEIIYGKITQRRRNRKRGTSTNTSGSSMVSGLHSEGSSGRDINKQKKRLVAADYERLVQSQESSEGEAMSVANQSLFSVQSSAGRSSGCTEDNIKFNKAARRESKKVKVLSMKLPRQQRVKYRQKHTTTQYKIGPQVITPMKLWSLIYLALRIHQEDIHLADMLRYAREGHLSYYRLDHLLPPEVTLTRKETNLLHQTKEITHKGVRQSVTAMAKFLNVWETKRPNLMSLIERYCIELQLPKEIATYAERMIAMSPPRMPFDAKTTCFPNYEGRAMAFIIVVLKILFALDGLTEYEISRVVEKINSAASSFHKSKLFSFCEWQRYIEARRNVLTNLHFPTKFKRDPDASGGAHLYLKFLAMMRGKSSDREEPVIESYKHLIPRELSDAMKKIIGKLDENPITMRNHTEIFAPSLTPQYSYLQHLLRQSERDLPSLLAADFYSTKVGYMTKSKALLALAARCEINLGIVDTGIHFLEKVVPTFEQSNLPSIQEFNRPVQVEKPNEVKTRSGELVRKTCDDLEEYLHRKNPGSLFVDRSKLNEYNVILKTLTERRSDDTTRDSSYSDFGFDEVFPNGKLVTQNDDDSEDDERPRGSLNTRVDEIGQIGVTTVHSLLDILAEYNLNLSNHEKNSLVDTLNGDCAMPLQHKTKRKTSKDPLTGKFVSTPTEFREKGKHAVSTIRKESGSRKQLNDATTRVTIDRSASMDTLDSSYDFDLDDDDISILRDTNFKSMTRNDGKRSSTFLESETLFRPYTDYWLLRCNFSRVKQKAFRELEKNLPSNFRWLLEECSNVVEMTETDLYEEVCLVETYYSDVLRPTECPLTENRYNVEEYRSKAHCNAIKKKW